MKSRLVIGLGVAVLRRFMVRAVLARECVRARRPVGVGSLDDVALDALAMTAAARTAMPRTPAAGAILALFFGLAVGALLGLDQRLAVGNWNLIIVGMDFAEGEKAMAVAAVVDEGGL